MEALGWMGALVMGTVLGMMGGGGSILTVPILVYLFKIEPVQATSYSLFIVGGSSLFGVAKYLRRKQLVLSVAVVLALPSFCGVLFSRRVLLPALPQSSSVWGWQLDKGDVIMGVFAVVMLASAYSMICGPKRIEEKSNDQHAGEDPLSVMRLVGMGGIGLVIGVVTGFVGAGGGFLIVPALVTLVGLPMKRAVATSLGIIAFNALLGFLGEPRDWSTVDWWLLGGIVAVAMSGIHLGTHLNRRISGEALRIGFGWLTAAMGAVILIRELVG